VFLLIYARVALCRQKTGATPHVRRSQFNPSVRRWSRPHQTAKPRNRTFRLRRLTVLCIHRRRNRIGSLRNQRRRREISHQRATELLPMLNGSLRSGTKFRPRYSQDPNRVFKRVLPENQLLHVKQCRKNQPGQKVSRYNRRENQLHLNGRRSAQKGSPLSRRGHRSALRVSQARNAVVILPRRRSSDRMRDLLLSLILRKPHNLASRHRLGMTTTKTRSRSNYVFRVNFLS
jgi:hypothetical protein